MKYDYFTYSQVNPDVFKDFKEHLYVKVLVSTVISFRSLLIFIIHFR